MTNLSIINSLYLLSEPPQPRQAFQKAFKGLSIKCQGSAVPWHLTMPEKAYKSFQKDVCIYETEVKALNLNYYNNTYLPTQKVFDYLQPAKVNTKKYEEYVQLDTTGHIRSFQPNKDGYAPKAEYDRTATVTGRLKTTSGPTLLHLPKVYRSVLQSRFTNGSIVSLDYKSLEPRVLLATCGTQPIKEEERDIYESVRSSLFSDNPEINREAVKKIVLSELYGAGMESLKQRLPNVRDIESVVGQISDWFNLEDLKVKLVKEWKETEYRWITNYYGRRVKTENAHTLVNHFIQSTAVDVGLFGFKNILEYIEELGRLDDVVPLFILHDAIIFDVKENAFSLINGLGRVGASDIKGLEQVTFYMSVDKNFTGK